MNKETFYLYKNAIQALYPDAWNFSVPKNAGSQNNIVFANVCFANIRIKAIKRELLSDN